MNPLSNVVEEVLEIEAMEAMEENPVVIDLVEEIVGEEEGEVGENPVVIDLVEEIVGEEGEVGENPVVIDLIEEIVGEEEDLPGNRSNKERNNHFALKRYPNGKPVVEEDSYYAQHYEETGEEIEEEEEEIEEIVREEEKEEALSYNMLAYMSDLCKATDDDLMQIICISDEELDASNLIGEDEVMVKIGEDWSDEDLKTPNNNTQDLVMPAVKGKGKGKGKGKRTRRESNMDEIDEEDIPSTSTSVAISIGNRLIKDDENDSDDDLDELSVSLL